jgi:hypothetical protein
LNKCFKSGVELKNDNQKWIIELDHIPVNDVGFGSVNVVVWVRTVALSLPSFPWRSSCLFRRIKRIVSDAKRELAVIHKHPSKQEFSILSSHVRMNEINKASICQANPNFCFRQSTMAAVSMFYTIQQVIHL